MRRWEAPPVPFPREIVPLEHIAELEGVNAGTLSSFFAPMLGHFVEETVRTSGTVWLHRAGERIDGILLRRDAEKTGSIFARTLEAAGDLCQHRGDLAVFSEYLLRGDPVPYPVYASDLATWSGAHRFRHPVRRIGESDIAGVVRLMREVYGSVDETWLRSAPHPREHGFVAELSGEIAGAAWVTIVGATGRLHSLSVAPRFRRLGIASDLWHARMLFARQAGAERVLTEIAETNVASRAIASAGGMQRIGQLFEYPRP
jgi:GNAT superfamily N-acetyltransferase